jgi:hypothetical protein
MKTYEDIDEAVKALEELHDSLLFDDDLVDHVDHATFAPHFYLTAVGNIDAAINQLKLAGLFLARERTGNF